MVTASSVRRSSRDKSSTPSNAFALSPDGVALNLLRQVIETEGRIITDPRNKLNDLLVKDGVEFSLSGEGKNWVPGHADPDQGFTFKNKSHERFFLEIMKDHVEVLEEWQDRLPDEARALIPADKLIEVVANVSPETKDKASKSTTAGKRKNKKPRKVSFYFGEDVPEELHEEAAEWKQCVEKGGEQFFGADEEPAKSLKDLEKQIKGIIRSFAYCTDTDGHMKTYKAKHLDPVAKRLITAVKRNVAQQAAQLEKEILEDLCLTDYHLENTFHKDVLEKVEDNVNGKENITSMAAVEE